jgi:hypothetical protein
MLYLAVTIMTMSHWKLKTFASENEEIGSVDVTGAQSKKQQSLRFRNISLSLSVLLFSLAIIYLRTDRRKK